jgi:hypothetical protein
MHICTLRCSFSSISASGTPRAAKTASQTMKEPRQAAPSSRTVHVRAPLRKKTGTLAAKELEKTTPCAHMPPKR